MTRITPVALLLLLAAALAPGQGDDFKREGKPERRAQKDALEGKPAPELDVGKWMNTPADRPLDLASLRGKVVVLDFWGTW